MGTMIEAAMGGYNLVSNAVRERRGYEAARKEFGDGPASAPDLYSALQGEKRSDAYLDIAKNQEGRAETRFGQETEEYETKRDTKGLLSIVDGLRKARDSGEDLGAAFDNLSSTLPSIGVDEAAIPELKKELLENPALLDQLKESLSTATGQRSGSLTEKQKYDIEQAQMAKAEAAEKITTDILTMKQHYMELDELSGIQNHEDNFFGRLGRSASQSWLGRKVGEIRGTREATLRQSIEAMRPGLLVALKAAEDLGAKMFDSNRDMELFLSNISDPTTNVHTAIAQLDNFNSKYGRALRGEEITPISVGDTDWTKPPANYVAPETATTLYPGMVDDETGYVWVGPGPGDWKAPGE